MLARMLLVVVLACANNAFAQNFPTAPVRIIVSSPPGGGTDILGRILAEKLRDKWGQTVIVENRGGAAGNIGADAVFRSPPDGYTLLVAAQAPLTINKSLYRKLNYDPDALVPVSMLASTPAVLLINPSVQAKNVSELIGLAKAQPGSLNYASQGVGNSAHLTAELLNSMSKIKTTHVPYKGTSPALVGLMGGEVQFMFGELATAEPHVAAGKLRIIGVASEKRSQLLPNIPAIAETLPGFLSITWWGMAAPPGTPPAVVNKISAAVADALKLPDVAQKLASMSIEPVGSTPAEMIEFMKKDRKLWGDVIRETGTTAD